MEPFPKAIGNRRWLLVGTGYFTKWVETEPLANNRDMDAMSLSVKILSLGLESLVHSSWTMVFNLIVKPSGGIAAT